MDLFTEKEYEELKKLEGHTETETFRGPVIDDLVVEIVSGSAERIRQLRRYRHADTRELIAVLAVYLCCTGLGVTSTGRYPASCPMKPGLSSSAAFRHLPPRLSVLLSTSNNYTKKALKSL